MESDAQHLLDDFDQPKVFTWWHRRPNKPWMEISVLGYEAILMAMAESPRQYEGHRLAEKCQDATEV